MEILYWARFLVRDWASVSGKSVQKAYQTKNKTWKHICTWGNKSLDILLIGVLIVDVETSISVCLTWWALLSEFFILHLNQHFSPPSNRETKKESMRIAFCLACIKLFVFCQRTEKTPSRATIAWIQTHKTDRTCLTELPHVGQTYAAMLFNSWLISMLN